MDTLKYAESELEKYIYKITGENKAEIAIKCDIESGHPFDDVATINVVGGKGYISASNPRAALIGVYRLFYLLGCRFIRPCEDGEIIVKLPTSALTAKGEFRPENRYRAVCSEGGISEKHVIDVVRWLPKIGMNGYFCQFADGHLFFEKWYKHKGSSVISPDENYSVRDSVAHLKNCVKAIKECGLVYHAVGHGWTTEPLGYVTYGDHRSTDADIRPEHRSLFAEINGKRGFHKDMPGDTQLCYSNPEARRIITDGIVDYLKVHPEVDILHFWLADGTNNHCECEECRKKMPSDLYVKMLNELDEKLTREKIDVKVAFLIYCDLLFAPETERLYNPDRFIMMYAPISRSFFEPMYTAANYNASVEKAEYRRNGNEYPATAAEYLDRLKRWQAAIHTDGFSFDYHLMTFPYGGDPSFLKISEVIFEDMKGLRTVGLNGNVSCQLQRLMLPIALPNYAMAAALVGDKTYAETETEYFAAAFGKDGGEAKDFLRKSESFYLSDAIRGKSDDKSELFRTIDDYACALDEISAYPFAPSGETEKLSVKLLKRYVETEKAFLSAYRAKCEGRDITAVREKLFEFIDEGEPEYERFEDALFKKDGVKSWL